MAGPVAPWRQIWRHLGAPRPIPPALPAATQVQALTAQLDRAGHTRLGRSLSLFHVETGSCGGCLLEIQALRGMLDQLRQLGLSFVASPRAADVLLVTGALSRNMEAALAATWEAMPAPRWLVGIGDCPIDGGVFKGSYAIGQAPMAFDLQIGGCAPTPEQILQGLLALLAANRGAAR